MARTTRRPTSRLITAKNRGLIGSEQGGKVTDPVSSQVLGNRRRLEFANRQHVDRARWLEDEARTRASYLATSRHLKQFLVPHRFEGNIDPAHLHRSRYGYGIGLNKAYLHEIIGNVVAAPCEYRWGPLAPDCEPTAARPPRGTLARSLWDDCDRRGTPWRRFFGSRVLEWMLSSLGGFIVVDVPPIPAQTVAEEQAEGKRPYVRWFPWSAVEDYFHDGTRYRWLKFEEIRYHRRPDDDVTLTRRPLKYHILYELQDDGTATVARYDSKGDMVIFGPDDEPDTVTPRDPIELGKTVDRQGEPILPVVPAIFGENPDKPDILGCGLLLDMADIVIDLYNVLSETREAFRDAAFGIFAHQGPDFDEVQKHFEDGSRLIPLGDSQNGKLERIAGDAGEVAAGLNLMKTGIESWALAAKRKAAEAVNRATARSGVSLQAEFQLDLKPMLVQVAEQLDVVEANVLWVCAQMAGNDVPLASAEPDGAAADDDEDPRSIDVTRNTEFQLEDEASRISRIVSEFTLAMDLTPEMKAQLTMKWVRASGMIDLDAPAEDAITPADLQGKGSVKNAVITVGDVIQEQARRAAETAAQNTANLAAAGAAGRGAVPFAQRETSFTREEIASGEPIDAGA